MNHIADNCPPFLKWAGGKRWLVKRCLDFFPQRFIRYIEPFLGSGALFFALKPRTAILADLNADLIETYFALRQNHADVLSALKRYQHQHSKRFYYSLRASRPRSLTSRAARFIYLNRTCWNGLYRVNTRGQFNVPRGTKENVVLASDRFDLVQGLLKNASLMVSDFEPTIELANAGDLVFADPPYVTSHAQNGFLKYNERLFCWADQVRLRDCLVRAVNRGVFVVATNADSPAIRALYEKPFKVTAVSRKSVIAASSDYRGHRTELVISNS